MLLNILVSGHNTRRQGNLSIQQWNTVRARKYNRDFERKKLEAHFNAEIVRRRQAGQSKEEIIADLGISRELFNRIIRFQRQIG